MRLTPRRAAEAAGAAAGAATADAADDVANNEERFAHTPHLMLYVLHEPAAPHRVRRMLLTSANLSTAAWGRRRGVAASTAAAADGFDEGGPLDIRSFELGVCVPPRDEAAACEGLPFDLASRVPCAQPRVGVRGLEQPWAGQLLY